MMKLNALSMPCQNGPPANKTVTLSVSCSTFLFISFLNNSFLRRNFIKMKQFYILTGSVFSFLYVLVGLMILTGKLNFDFQPTTKIIVGTGISAYGLFRVYMFY